MDFTYKKLATAVKDAGGRGWTHVLESLTAEDWNGNSRGKSFNNELVIEKAADAYRRDPTEKELELLYKELYELPMSGKKEPDGDGGAE